MDSSGNPGQSDREHRDGAPARSAARAGVAIGLTLLLVGAGVTGYRVLGQRDAPVSAVAASPPTTGASQTPSPSQSPPLSSSSPSLASAVSPAASALATPTPAPTSADALDMAVDAVAAPASSAAGITAADRAAGLRTMTVQDSASGALHVVPGQLKAPGAGPVKRVRVEVERGLNVDGSAFAATVMATLNDPRSWGKGGRMTFARVSGAADIRVVLASPSLSASMCRPLVTYGKLSCGSGNAAVLTMYRWVNGTADYGNDRAGYRRYLVNHEVGHILGHGHQSCPGKGRLAPVMQQQTKGLLGCRPNSWPYP